MRLEKKAENRQRWVLFAPIRSQTVTDILGGTVHLWGIQVRVLVTVLGMKAAGGPVSLWTFF